MGAACRCGLLRGRKLMEGKLFVTSTVLVFLSMAQDDVRFWVYSMALLYANLFHNTQSLLVPVTSVVSVEFSPYLQKSSLVLKRQDDVGF